MLVYERIRNCGKLIQGGPKRKTLSRIIIKSFERTPEGALTVTSFTYVTHIATLWVRHS